MERVPATVVGTSVLPEVGSWGRFISRYVTVSHVVRAQTARARASTALPTVQPLVEYQALAPVRIYRVATPASIGAETRATGRHTDTRETRSARIRMRHNCYTMSMYGERVAQGGERDEIENVKILWSLFRPCSAPGL